MISVSIRPSRCSYGIISKSREFAINIPTEELLKKTDFCGIHSGSNIDKFKACGLNPIQASHISAPLIAECPVNIECKVKDILRLGVHDLFIGEVIAIHADKKLIDKNGRIDYSKTAPIVYLQGEYWNLNNKIGTYGFSSNK